MLFFLFALRLLKIKKHSKDNKLVPGITIMGSRKPQLGMRRTQSVLYAIGKAVKATQSSSGIRKTRSTQSLERHSHKKESAVMLEQEQEYNEQFLSCNKA